MVKGVTILEDLKMNNLTITKKCLLYPNPCRLSIIRDCSWARKWVSEETQIYICPCGPAVEWLWEGSCIFLQYLNFYKKYGTWTSQVQDSHDPFYRQLNISKLRLVCKHSEQKIRLWSLNLEMCYIKYLRNSISFSLLFFDTTTFCYLSLHQLIVIN